MLYQLHFNVSLKRNIEIAIACPELDSGVNAANKRKRLWEKANQRLISILNRYYLNIKEGFFDQIKGVCTRFQLPGK